MRLCIVTKSPTTVITVKPESESNTFKSVAELAKDMRRNPESYDEGTGYYLIDEDRPILYKSVKETTFVTAENI